MRHAKTCLVIAAHPDDEALGCGGTIARLSLGGTAVHISFLSDGVASRTAARRPGADDEALAVRQAHAKAAARILGAQSVVFGPYADNRLDGENLLDVTKHVESLVDAHRPDVVLTHHAGDLNVDHRVVHQAVMTACRPQPGHPVTAILLFEVPSSTEWQAPTSAPPFVPNYFVDISAHLATRNRALLEYDMEMRPWPHARSYEALDHLARWRGASAGVHAAEAFVLARMVDRA